MKKLLLKAATIAFAPLLLFQSFPGLQPLPPPPPWGDDARRSGDFYFQPRPCGTIEVWYVGSEAVVVIPSEIEGYAVTKLGVGVISSVPNWGGRFGGTRMFIVPKSVTSIDDGQFDRERASFRREFGNAIDNIIFGYTGSFAETFASENNILFMPLDDGFPVIMFFAGNLIEFDEALFIEEDIIFVPLRAFFENIRLIHPNIEARNISWDDETQSVTVELYDWFDLPPALFETIKLTIGSGTFSIDGDTLRGSLSHNQLQTNIFEMEAPARIVNNRAFVPLSFFLDYFDFGIEYDWSFSVFDIHRNSENSNIPFVRMINEIRFHAK